MSLWNQSLSSYGGALLDQNAVIDPTVDSPAYGINQALSSNAGMTLTTTKVWVQFQPVGTGTPLWIAEADIWSNNTANAASIVARTGVGIYTITCPATVFDDIPTSLPGVNAPVPGSTAAGFPTSLTSAKATCESTVSTDDFECQAYASSANVITVYIRNGSSRALSDPTAINFSVFAT